ncbi:hypothetical protein FGK63_10885 [Ruegeria sediminis]|uniref:Inositolphosphotransferase Aur1/Ipt1 domain-containing protein n=1 Tax=Ruegeria sediminis TaxID=2583820 RepID=A0ABY2WYL0_9RHOB|nr:phosphatase PAP2 family protein [Ruegeria sediminis]TMV07948.1 hypothetical protein FGK63_10885 [Ruegeria sediminis]
MTETAPQYEILQANKGWFGSVDRIERLLLGLLLGLVVLCAILSSAKNQAVSWSAFGLSLAPSFALFVAGIYIRTKKNKPNLANLAVANSLYLGFTGATTLLIFLRFPIQTPLLDERLMQIDAVIGYSWPEFVQLVGTYPTAARILGFVYMSSLPQLFFLVAFLALTGRVLSLHRALCAGSLSLLMTTIIWWALPSIGPSAYFNLPEGLADSIGLVTNAEYGAYLVALANNGLSEISPADIVGTIAFPSYHTVMALLVVWYLRGSVFFVPAAILNLAMMPAILSHGGHHMIDVAGGVVIFAIAAAFAATLTPQASYHSTCSA